jgi:Leucine-rich repeat (LRR) protein
MEMLKGESLDARLEREGALPIAEVLRIGREIAEGLAVAHSAGLIHRDIKPANVWLEAPQARVKILDFGLARAASQDAGLTQQGAIIGTPAYMAPEQGRGGSIDSRCDLFSLGVVIYQMGCGRLPFRGRETMSTLMSIALDQPTPPRRTNAKLPQALSDLVMTLLEKDPNLRPASASAVVEALQAIEQGGWYRRQSRPAAWRRLGWVAAAVLLLGLIVGGLWGLGLIRISTPEGEFVIQTDDPQFSFSRGTDGGFVMEDRTSHRKYQVKAVRQSNDEYELEVTDAGAELTFHSKTLTVKRDQKVVLKAWFERTVAEVISPADADKLKNVAALPPEKQVEVVTAWLKERNPAFDGQVKHQIENGAVTSFEASSQFAEDLSPLRALPGLKTLTCRPGFGCDHKSERDALLLRTLKSLETVNGKPLAEFRKHITAKQAEFNEWLKVTGLLPAEDQVKAVAAKLKERNPDFDGQVTHKIEDGAVTVLQFLTFGVTDLSPVRALAGLRSLQCQGRLEVPQSPLTDLSPLKGMSLTDLAFACTCVSDLTPLKGMKLTWVSLGVTNVADLSPLRDMKLEGISCAKAKVSDLSPLQGMPLTLLACHRTQVADLTPVKNSPLTYVECSESRVSDLSPLKDMPLTYLAFLDTPVADLTPLQGMKLAHLNCGATRVSDLSPLQGMKLTFLNCQGIRVVDLSPLKGMPLTQLNVWRSWVSDLTPLKDMPLTHLSVHEARVSDLSPLKGMQLQHLDCDLKPERDAPVIRSLRRLQTINGKPAAEVRQELVRQALAADPWLKEVAAMPPDKQVEAVTARLKQRNPAFDGQLKHKIEDNVVRAIEVPSHLAEDLSALWALPGLKTLTCRPGFGYDHKAESDAMLLDALKSLETVNGKPIAEFRKHIAAKQAEFQEWLKGTAPLAPEDQVQAVAAKLKERNPGFDSQVAHKIDKGVVVLFGFQPSNATDLSPVRALTGLRELHCGGVDENKSPLTDLSPLQGMNLSSLVCYWSQVSDLSPLQDMKLTFLNCGASRVTDLEPLQGMPLTVLGFAQTEVSDLAPVQRMKLTDLEADLTKISDLGPLKGMPLTILKISGTGVSDLSPLRGMPLTYLRCHDSSVSDLSPLKDMPLSMLHIENTKVTDLAPLKETKLTELWCWRTGVTDFSPLKKIPLKVLRFDVKPERDAGILRAIKTLEVINEKPAAEFFKDVDAQLKADLDAWLKTVEGVSSAKLIDAVTAKLKARNPQFDREMMTHEVLDGVVTHLDVNTANVTDISPLRAFTGLRTLSCGGRWENKSLLSDLSPLQGMKLTSLSCSSSQVTDLSPLKGMPLTKLDCMDGPLSDLAPLKDMKLTYLRFTYSQVSDLSPLKGMPLDYLEFMETKVSDLSPLQGMPLTQLDCGCTPVRDLTPIKDLKLKHLDCNFTQVTDLSPLKDMKLTYLVISRLKVSDLSPLKGMPIKQLICDFKPERDAEIVRSIKTLESINGKPAAEFWRDVEGKKP